VEDEVLGRSVDEVEETSVVWGHFKDDFRSEDELVLHSFSALEGPASVSVW